MSRLLAGQLVIELVLEVDLTGRLRDPAVEGVEQRSVLLPDWVNLLLPPDVVVLIEMSIKMCLELLVSNEAMSAIGALELDTLVEFGDGDDVESINVVRRVYLTYSFRML